MKKCFLMLLVAALMLSFAANADSRAAMLGDRLFLSLETQDSDGVNLHDERTIKHLQADGEYIYYVACEPLDDERHSETLMRMDADGNETVLAESRIFGTEYAYTEDYSRLTDYSFYPGYGDMTVYGDYIYFIGANNVPGSYFTCADGWGGYDGEYETRYETTSSLYRMDKDGGNPMELIGGLGNEQCHMDIANDVIAVASCWRNGIYAYDFADFRLYDLDGGLIREIENSTESRHSWIYKADCEFTCIVGGVQTDGERIYASLGDSEGDFASSRLTDMDDSEKTILYEAFYVPSILLADGSFISLCSAAEDEFYFDGMDQTLRLQLTGPEGVMLLACVPEEFASWGDMHLSLSEGMVYLSSLDRAIRVPIDGGSVQKWSDGGFVAAPEYGPAHYKG